ncbi:hypothetical protein CC80DRAFT_318558 [Byssothecium circinans]|uniref:Uncharacterized protein n=1 Tax=Byssothecium circinans TaxID=147558 RepID=A0A6A5U2A5_9PLEO|nr:hypothetical protein CC80DRAFT_318558 [Byssothecium circinans]
MATSITASSGSSASGISASGIDSTGGNLVARLHALGLMLSPGLQLGFVGIGDGRQRRKRQTWAVVVLDAVGMRPGLVTRGIIAQELDLALLADFGHLPDCEVLVAATAIDALVASFLGEGIGIATVKIMLCVASGMAGVKDAVPIGIAQFVCHSLSASKLGQQKRCSPLLCQASLKSPADLGHSSGRSSCGISKTAATFSARLRGSLPPARRRPEGRA